MLDVVVQRALDEGDLAPGQRHQRHPVVVEVRELRRRERERVLEQVTTEQRGCPGDGVGDQQREEVGVVVGAPVPPRLRDQLPVTRDDARVAVDELGAPDRADQRCELVPMPVVVLVGHRHVFGVGSHHRQRALEVAIEAEPPGRARDGEARVSADLPLERGIGIGVRAVVADEADPVPVGLGPDRVELAPQQVERRVIGRHADRDARAGRVGPRCDDRLGRGQHADAGELGHDLAARLEPGPQRELELVAGGLRRDLHDPPEAAAVAVQERVLGGARVAREPDRRGWLEPGMQSLERVQSRHPVGHHGLRRSGEHELERAHPRLGAEAPAAHE